MNKILLKLTLLCLLMPLFVCADSISIKEQGVEYIIPKNSLVSAYSVDELNKVSFKGEFKVRGRFEYAYTKDSVNGPLTEELMLSFYPAKSISHHFPYLNGKGFVNEIFISNPEEFVNAVLPKEQMKLLKNKKNHENFWRSNNLG